MVYLISLIITTVLILYLALSIYKNKIKSQINKCFLATLICLLIWCLGLIGQILFSKKYNINPIYFDYFVYIGTCFLPVAFFFTSLVFANTRIGFKRIFVFLFIIPMLSLILLWTNNSHNLFYLSYDTNMSSAVPGSYFYIHSVYTYGLLFISFYILLKHSIRQTGIFSKQALLIIAGGLIPLITNVLGVLHVINMSIYITPITFVFTIILCALAIFKFGFLKITPIALKKIVNTISDSYIVLNKDMLTVDCNDTFLKTFNIKKDAVLNKNFFSTTNKSKKFIEFSNIIINAIEKTSAKNSTITFDYHFTGIEKYFHIEVTSIFDGKLFLGTLILFKDVTQHELDMQTIKDNQNILIERERLASLGQMIGGIAHNLKTPIMSISGASEGLIDLINEYKSSAGDPEVTVEDHLEIAKDMEDWISKIKTYLSYMSDVISAVKGQAVAFTDSSAFVDFTVDDLVRQVEILMKHELTHSQVELEKSIQLPGDTVVKGNVNSLVQVINNILSNAIQAYNGKTGEKIILQIFKYKQNVVFKIQDFAGGIPDSVKDKLFKQMTTTKGKNGTGLGLFMSYSNIKAHFNGDLRFEVDKGKGTTFIIEIPIE